MTWSWDNCGLDLRQLHTNEISCMAVVFFKLRWALSNTIVCFNSLVYSVRMDYRPRRLNSDSFQMEPPVALRRWNSQTLQWDCRKTELMVLAGTTASVYVGRFFSASIVSSAFLKWRSLPVRKVYSSTWGSAYYLCLQQQKCWNQVVLPSRNLLLLLGLLVGRLKGNGTFVLPTFLKSPRCLAETNKQTKR